MSKSAGLSDKFTKGLLAGLAAAGVAGATGAGVARHVGARQDRQQAGRDTFKKLLGAGVLAGSGIAGIDALRRHMELLKAQAEAETARDKARETVALPYFDKAAAGPQWLPTAGGILAALLGGAVSHKAVTSAYDAFRKRELARMLQDAEEGHTDALLREHDTLAKQAASGSAIKPREWLVPLLLASLPAAALASGYGVQRLMNRTFEDEDPALADPATIGDEQMPAVLIQRQRDKKAAREDLLQLMLDTAVTFKEARELRALTTAAAAGALPEMTEIVTDQGFDKLASVLLDRGYDQVKPDPVSYAVGSLLLIKSATFRPTLELLTAAEIQEQAPGICKVASNLDRTTGDWLVELAAKTARCLRGDRLGLLEFNEEELSKQASAQEILPEFGDDSPEMMLQALLDQQNGMPPETDAERRDQDDDTAQDLALMSVDQSEDSHPDAMPQPEDAIQKDPQDVVDHVFG